MKPTKSRPIAIAVVMVAVLLLLWPGMVMAMAWTAINFEVAFVAIGATIAMAIWVPKLRWVGAVIAALLIAVPPYPYWVFSSNARGWYIHFFHGFNMENLPIWTFVIYFLIALLIFKAIFWAVGSLGRKKET